MSPVLCLARSLLGATLLVVAASTPALADTPPPTTTPEAPTVAEARTRYRRGVELFQEGNHGAALVEFRRAFSLTHEYRVLYNIAQVCFRLNDYVCSLQSFESYLEQGGDGVAAERVDEVRGYLERLRPRVGSLAVITESDAEVTIDDVRRGKTPILVDIALAVGQHRLVVAKPGKAVVVRTIEVAGTEHREEVVTLVDSTKVIVRDAPQKPSRWTALSLVGLGSAALLAGGATATGIAALNTSNTLERTPYLLGREGDLSAQRSKVRVLRTTSDVLAASAIVTLAVTLYLTLKTPAKAPPARVGLALSPDVVGLSF